jgi:uncharacterized membrane protein
MKFLGHPLHLMLIHFPSALFPMELLSYSIYYFTNDESFATASLYALMAGSTLGWLAIITGAIDLLKISPERTKVMNKALIHGSVNTTVVLAYSVFAWIGFRKYPQLPEANLAALVLKLLLVTLMLVGNYMGGSLVLKDKMGTMENE